MIDDISVVHLVYVPYGTNLLKAFIATYQQYDAEKPHRLIFLLNGFRSEKELLPFIEVIDHSGVKSTILRSPEAYDISSYFYAARMVTSEYLLFLNSFSTLLVDGWLRFYSRAFRSPNVGVVGATGAGWRSEYSRFITRETSGFTLGGTKSKMFMWFNFRKFRGPHIRTNAFMIRREVFLKLRYHRLNPQIAARKFGPDSKLRTLCFENGNENMTHQIRQLGLSPMIVDKYGNVYEENYWREAKTLWISDQENLIIHDNQTQRYQDGTGSERAELRYWAWGI